MFAFLSSLLSLSLHHFFFFFSFYTSPSPHSHCGIVGRRNCLSWPESDRLHTGQVVIVLNGIVYRMQLSQMAWNCWECIGEIGIVWNDKDWIGLKDVVSSFWPDWTWGLWVGWTLLFVNQNVMSFSKKKLLKIMTSCECQTDNSVVSVLLILSVDLQFIERIFTKTELPLLWNMTSPSPSLLYFLPVFCLSHPLRSPVPLSSPSLTLSSLNYDITWCEM